MRVAILLLLALVAVTQSQALNDYKRLCVAYAVGQCITCPFNYHQYQNECYRNITGCLTYSTNRTGLRYCTQCNQTISLPDDKGGCALTVNLEELQSEVYYQRLSTDYGDLRFQLIPLNQALADPHFRVANDFMLKGQYKHFISQTSQPIQSVSTFNSGDKIEYKILYSGSGGGLMMCLISVNRVSYALILQSFVPIGITRIIEYCNQYSLDVQCIQCMAGYHLQEGVCYPNVEGCATYLRNICLQCSGYAVLVENRCITGCGFVTDLAKLIYYGDVRLLGGNWAPTLSRQYLF